VVIDEPTRTLNVHGRTVDVTPTEWGILLALASAPGRVYSRAELINRVRGHEFEGYERSVDSHIKNLRRKVEPDPHHPSVVLTVLGGGYRFGLSRDG
jgi:DNA-binding response OmpR family regulator